VSSRPNSSGCAFSICESKQHHFGRAGSSAHALRRQKLRGHFGRAPLRAQRRRAPANSAKLGRADFVDGGVEHSARRLLPEKFSD